MGWQRRGQEPTQQHQRARHVRGSGQKRSDDQGERHARSGIINTAAGASTAIETLDEARRRRRQQRREKR